jgi:hypothetical protein
LGGDTPSRVQRVTISSVQVPASSPGAVSSPARGSFRDTPAVKGGFNGARKRGLADVEDARVSREKVGKIFYIRPSFSSERF